MGHNDQNYIDLRTKYQKDFQNAQTFIETREEVSREDLQSKLHISYERAQHFLDKLTAEGLLKPAPFRMPHKVRKKDN